jgi:hypothetical protein
MANPEHLEMISKGARAWNMWRASRFINELDLSGADLSDSELFIFHGERGIDGTEVELHGSAIKVREVEMFYSGINLTKVNLCNTNLQSSLLQYADFTEADLIGANLSGTDLYSVNFNNANLTNANFTDASIGWTTFAKSNLSRVIGLETVKHSYPSSIGIEVLYISGGQIPEVFLRGCGMPEEFITYARSLTTTPIEFYSCFISYSSKDQEFAERLYADLQAKGVRVWFAPHDLPIGARIRPAIDESIHLHDKLLLVLSKHSVSSQWVEQEVETALAKEREQEGRTVLFPIRIDDAVMESKAGWPTLLKNTRNVGDFTRWKEHDSYWRAFDRLLRDLKAEEKKA